MMSTTEGEEVTNVGGVYTDPNHAPITASANLFDVKAPWYGGLRILGRTSPTSKEFTCIGNDDGIHWWTLSGNFTDVATGKVSMDFTPKAPGVGLLQCGYDGSKGHLHFFEDDGTTIGNTWSRLQATEELALEPQVKHAAFNDINGLYVDPEIFQKNGKNTFAGIRVVSDRLGKFLTDDICVVGTDDGVEWWAYTGGKFTNRRRGEFQVADAISEAKCSSGTIQLTFKDGKEGKWTKMKTTMDFHTLPKQE